MARRSLALIHQGTNPPRRVTRSKLLAAQKPVCCFEAARFQTNLTDRRHARSKVEMTHLHLQGSGFARLAKKRVPLCVLPCLRPRATQVVYAMMGHRRRQGGWARLVGWRRSACGFEFCTRDPLGTGAGGRRRRRQRWPREDGEREGVLLVQAGPWTTCRLTWWLELRSGPAGERCSAREGLGGAAR